MLGTALIPHGAERFRHVLAQYVRFGTYASLMTRFVRALLHVWLLHNATVGRAATAVPRSESVIHLKGHSPTLAWHMAARDDDFPAAGYEEGYTKRWDAGFACCSRMHRLTVLRTESSIRSNSRPPALCS